MTLALAPAVAFLFIKKTEDCFTCFSRYPIRYSNYQYQNKMIAVAGYGLFETKSIKDDAAGQNDFPTNSDQNACNNSRYTGRTQTLGGSIVETKSECL
jgi:hypothetical protein